MTWTLDFSLPILVELIEDDGIIGAEIVGSQMREAPIVTDPIAPSYSAFLGEEVILEFNFADPLILQESSSSQQLEGELTAEGLQISVLSNDLAGIVTVEEISYRRGVGFAYLRLKVDGVEAETLL